jgi:hypothetical protein
MPVFLYRKVTFGLSLLKYIRNYSALSVTIQIAINMVLSKAGNMSSEV